MFSGVCIFKNKTSKRGFGIVQVLVAILLLSMLSLGLMSTMNQMYSSSDGVRRKMQFLESAAEVSALIKDGESCKLGTFLDANGNLAYKLSDIQSIKNMRFHRTLVPNEFVESIVVQELTPGNPADVKILLKAQKHPFGPTPRDYEIPTTLSGDSTRGFTCYFSSGGTPGAELVPGFRNATICANGSGAEKVCSITGKSCNGPCAPLIAGGMPIVQRCVSKSQSPQVVWRVRGVSQDGSVEYNAYVGGENTTRSAILTVDPVTGQIKNFDSQQSAILQPPPDCPFKSN